MHIAVFHPAMGEETATARPHPARLGKYHVLELIGEGSMGRVFLARDPALERDVAVKVMAGAALSDARMRERFEREAKSVARLHHPNIVTIHDLGYDEHGLPFIAMELLRGETLEAVIEAASLSIAARLEVIEQICRGLAHAHANGIVHRDIKPANVFLAEDGTAKLMDFGVARWSQASRTQAGLVVGTAGYMSPEQLRGKPVDGRADVFSLGVVLYELLTHQLLFAGDTLETIFFKTLSRDTPQLALRDGTRVPELQTLLERALARDVAARFATAEEMGRALTALLDGRRASLEDRGPLLAIEPSAPAGRAGTDSPRRRSSQPTVRLPRPSDAAAGESSASAPRKEPPRPRGASSAGRKGRHPRPSRGARLGGVAAALVAIALGVWASRSLGPEPLGLGAEPKSPQDRVAAPAPPATVPNPTPTPTSPSEPASETSEPHESLLADAALALAAGKLDEAQALVERGEDLAPQDDRWAALRRQLRARRSEIARRARAAQEVARADALVAAGDIDGALAAYEAAMSADPESAEARSGLERARSQKQAAEQRHARAASPARRFVESRTDYQPPGEGGGELLGFESEDGLDVKETADPFFPAQVVIELTPPDAQPGEPYVLRVRVFNEGYRPLALRDVTLVSVFDGKTSGRGQPLPVRVSRIEPRATVLAYEASGTWKETYASGSIEAVVTLEDGGELRKSLRW